MCHCVIVTFNYLAEFEEVYSVLTYFILKVSASVMESVLHFFYFCRHGKKIAGTLIGFKESILDLKITSPFLIATLIFFFLLSGKGAYSWKAVSLSWFQFFCLLQLPMLDPKMLVECVPVLQPGRGCFFCISCDFFFSQLQNRVATKYLAQDYMCSRGCVQLACLTFFFF